MSTNDIQPWQTLERGPGNAAKWLLRFFMIVLIGFLAFVLYLAAHEGGHLLADELQYLNHGTSIKSFDERILWVSIAYEDGRWGGPFWSPTITSLARTGLVLPAQAIVSTEWETGLQNLAGSISTTVIALITLVILNLRTGRRRFAFFAIAFALSVLFFDQILYTFVSQNPEPLVSAVRMGINPDLFKGFVVILILLEALLMGRYCLSYRRSKSAVTAQS